MIKQIHSQRRHRNQSARTTIHVSIRSTKSSSIIRSRSNHSKTESTSKKSYQLSVASIIPSKIHSDKWANSTDYTKKLKRKSINYRLIIIGGIISIILIATMTISLSVLLVSKPIKAKNYPNRSVVLRWNRTGLTVAGVTSKCGNASDLLCNPWDLYMDWSNTLYIADCGNHRVQKYVKNAVVGETVAGQTLGTNGNESNSLYNPYYIHVDLNDNVYVSDAYNHRIQLWTRGASNGTTIAGKTGVSSYASDRLYYPMGIVRDPSKGGLYIVDYANQRVMYYPDGIINGTLIAGGNGVGTNNNQLNYSTGVYFDVVSNSFFIANRNANNIIQWVLGAKNWTLVAGNKNGTGGNTASTFWTPNDVTLDPMGNVYVADSDNSRVQFFSIGEKNGTTIAGNTSLFGPTSRLFQRASSITLDSQLNLYVSDHGNHRIQKFMRY